MNQPSTACAAVVALKDLDQAKSRFGEVPAALRERLALLMLVDTVHALADTVHQIVIVTSVPGVGALLEAYGCLGRGAAVEFLADPGEGLNAAFTAGAERLRERGVRRVIAMMADLPALRPESVRRLVAATTEPGRHFVPDAAGSGTTTLVATDVALEPAFGPDSAARHRTDGAQPWDAPADLRLDVDQVSDLAAASELGVGAATSPLLDGSTLAEHRVVTVLASDAVVDAAGRRLELPSDAIEPRLREVRPGQRLHATLVPGRITHAWL